MADKEKIQKRQEEILELMQGFCAAKLDEEYSELAEKMLKKLGRKKHIPFETGKVEIWAAAIIHALGTINFLFDKSQTPHCKQRDIYAFFGTKESTVGNKSKEIRDMFKLRHWDDEFSTHDMLQNKPFDFLPIVKAIVARRSE